MAASSPKPTSSTLSQTSRKDSVLWGTLLKVLELMLTVQPGKGDLPESMSRARGMGLNKSHAHSWSWGWSELWAVPQKKVWMLLLNENGPWAAGLTYVQYSPTPWSKWTQSYTLQPTEWMSASARTSFCPVDRPVHTCCLLLSILSTRDLQSTWALPHTLSCLAKCHCTPRKHSFIPAPTPSWCGAESLRCKPAGTNLECASRSRCLPSSSPGSGILWDLGTLAWQVR